MRLSPRNSKSTSCDPPWGERFVAIGKVQSSGKLLAVCIGEVHAFSEAGSKLVAIMQATIVNVRS
jgi:acyl-coenzyme A thioesterase PaaI-like protein